MKFKRGEDLKKIYVCSPCKEYMDTHGQTISHQLNMARAKSYSYYVMQVKQIPITPHLYFTQFLDDGITIERAWGMMAGLELLKECDELWVFGDYVSQGMATEIEQAKINNILIKYI